MKKRDLERRLRELRWRFERHGGNHDVWTNGVVFEFIPRHAEVKEGLAKKSSNGWKVILQLSRTLIMELEGKIWKSGKFWLVEVPSLDAMTQGKSREDALVMIEDLVSEMMRSYFKSEIGKGFKVTVSDYKKETIGITTNETKLLQALSLRRQREKSGSTVKEAAERLGSKSPNAYAQYERGSISISVDKFEDLLEAANPFEQRKLRLV